MIRIPCIIIGYFIGCIQTAYITGKKKANIDIREFGSGNAGTTNITRELGLKTGAFVFMIDVLKAVLAFVLCSQLFTSAAMGNAPLGFYAGVGVILGHNFPVFLNFKGGKGIASSLGVILCVDWRAALTIFAVGVILIAITRFISLGSVVMLSLFPICTLLWGKGAESVILAFILAGLAIFQHRGNIKRLLNGDERRFSFKKGGDAASDHRNETGSDKSGH
ncbi:MAG: glycerol-3-phosphate 1-O-acyltransferase PlsY [Clostridiales bacterium]|jgi:glycerol-3-phosphate acyltransferase PlsY|nr:glycerol-3-phosphate 1-O-acyltransferase PlsY [Clostridiales bacterium]